MLGIRRYLRFDAPLRRWQVSFLKLPRSATLSASSAVLPAAQASSLQQALLFSLSRNRLASTRTTQLALTPSTATATDEWALQMQPSALSVYHSTWKQRSTCSSGRACLPHACCACPSHATGAGPSVPKPLPASPAVRPLSSESTVPTLLQLLRFLAPAWTVPCVAVTQPYFFDTIFKSTKAIHIDCGHGLPAE